MSLEFRSRTVYLAPLMRNGVLYAYQISNIEPDCYVACVTSTRYVTDIIRGSLESPAQHSRTMSLGQHATYESAVIACESHAEALRDCMAEGVH